MTQERHSPSGQEEHLAPAWLAEAGPQLQQIYAYWVARCRDGRLPRRADIDPVDIPRLLSNIMLIDVVPDAGRPNARNYIYRLVGTREVELRGNDPTGKSVADAFFGFSPEDALGWYDRTVETGQPQYDGRPYVATNGRWMSDETIFLPLSDDGESVNRVLVFAAVSRNEPTPTGVSARRP